MRTNFEDAEKNYPANRRLSFETRLGGTLEISGRSCSPRAAFERGVRP